MENFVVDWGFSWSVVFTGLVVVFVVLLLLVLFCAMLGKIFSSIANGKSKKETISAETSAPTTVKPQASAAVVEMVQDGIGNEVVAAITAAVTMMMSEDGTAKPFAVKSITRAGDARSARTSRSAWNTAGVQENTRPF